ncbi:3-hydroxyisobutyrate dehydrogenase [Aliidongia dinghuensis]|uniref:3-hydroxyisobutyrate dehydrogenase n=1 Tax=Aliidongia dinghuensis TaxID=1867774 RepID=A0A8J2Z0W4_9PROT|nr:NAD(P)-dependent oxidoreductase [Aliidongia dinghuensis]GGF45714.1 3-hydroxyisobutyrate dehydrogenase [Aliidongia dinghuensis]
MRVAIAGLGRMGRAFAAKIGADGAPVRVWNRTRGRADGLVHAVEVATAVALVEEADVILTSLTDDTAVEAIYDELLAGPVAGRLFVEMSTIRPETVRGIAARSEALGARLIDAPVAGGPAVVAASQSLAFVGGEAQDVERARPVLGHFCRKVAHMGPVGSGTVMKLVANLPIGVYFQALAEGLALGQRHGLDLEAMLAVMIDSPGALAALPRKLPAILGEVGDIPFDIAGVRKDLLAMTAACHQAGVPTPAATGALAAYASATAAGWGAKDFSTIIRFWAEAVAGVKKEGITKA